MSRLMTKPTKWHVRPAKTQISLGIRPVWQESSLSAWRKLGSLAAHWVHSEDSDQTGWKPRLIWVFAGRTVILFVLSWGGSNYTYMYRNIINKGSSSKSKCCWRKAKQTEPPHDKTIKMTCAPSEDSDQPGHLPSLIRAFAVRSIGSGCPGWSESQLYAQIILLVLSCGGSIIDLSWNI